MRKGDTLEESKTYPGAWMWTSLRVTGRGIAKKNVVSLPFPEHKERETDLATWPVGPLLVWNC